MILVTYKVDDYTFQFFNVKVQELKKFQIFLMDGLFHFQEWMIFAHLWLFLLRMKQIAFGALTVRCEGW